MITLEEGDFSSWSVYDSQVDTELSPSFMYQWAIFNEAETVALFVDAYSAMVRRYTVATKTLSALLEDWVSSDYPEKTPARSIYGTYAVFLDKNTYNVKIYKNAFLVQTLTEAELGFDANDIDSIDMSLTGKYIIVTGDQGGNKKWVILEGF